VPEVVRKLGVTEQTYYRCRRECTLGRGMVTERRVCRVLGQARNTQRRRASVIDDEPQFVKRIVRIASEYGRYGYRRIAAVLRAEGRWVNHKRAERILATGGSRSACETAEAGEGFGLKMDRAFGFGRRTETMCRAATL
jgi:hypothetical protein